MGWHRTFPRTRSRDTSCSTSPETEPATGKSPADCRLNRGGVAPACRLLCPVHSHKYLGFNPRRWSFALECHSDPSRRMQAQCQPPGLRPFKPLWAHAAASTLDNKTAESATLTLHCGIRWEEVQEADIVTRSGSLGRWRQFGTVKDDHGYFSGIFFF